MITEPAPDWLEEILGAIGLTDGVDLVKWSRDESGAYVVQIDSGEEELTFHADTDGQIHGVKLDGAIHPMTTSYDVQWWIAGEFYMRLQQAKRKIAEPFHFQHEDCRLVAVWTGEGWSLEVQDRNHVAVALLAWPESWGQTMTNSELEACGFEIQ